MQNATRGPCWGPGAAGWVTHSPASPRWLLSPREGAGHRHAPGAGRRRHQGCDYCLAVRHPGSLLVNDLEVARGAGRVGGEIPLHFPWAAVGEQLCLGDDLKAVSVACHRLVTSMSSLGVGLGRNL